MCKTRFGSQGVILDGLKQKSEKNLNGSREPPSPFFMANANRNFHSFGNHSLSGAAFFRQKTKNNSYKNYIYILIITWLRDPSLGVRLPLRSTIVVMQLASLIR